MHLPFRFHACTWAAAVSLLSITFWAWSAAERDQARSVVEDLYRFRASHGAAQMEEILPLHQWLSPGLLERCRAYVSVRSPPDLAPAIDYDVLTGSREALAPRFRARLLMGGPDWHRYVVTASHADGGRREDIDVVVARLRPGWRVTQIGRLRDDCSQSGAAP